jgi:hypothetical protein
VRLRQLTIDEVKPGDTFTATRDGLEIIKLILLDIPVKGRFETHVLHAHESTNLVQGKIYKFFKNHFEGWQSSRTTKWRIERYG